MSKEIKLTQNRVAIVDDEDYDALSELKWTLVNKNSPYACHYYRKGKKVFSIYMHRFLLGITDFTTQVDHIDGNGLNNTRSNLRMATQSQNSANRRGYGKSGYKGVYTSGNKWQARINNAHLGVYCTKEDAAKEYDKAALDLFGSFAKTNF